MGHKVTKRLAKVNSTSKRGTNIPISSSYMSLIKMINLRGDEYAFDVKLDSFDYCNKFHDTAEIENFNKLHNICIHLKLVLVDPGDRTCH